MGTCATQAQRGHACATLTTQEIPIPTASDNREEAHGPTTAVGGKQQHMAKELNHANTGTRQQDQKPMPKPQPPKKKTPNQQQQGKRAQKNQDKLRRMDYLQVPARTARGRKRPTQEGKADPMPQDKQQKTIRGRKRNSRNISTKIIPNKNLPPFENRNKPRGGGHDATADHYRAANRGETNQPRTEQAAATVRWKPTEDARNNPPRKSN